MDYLKKIDLDAHKSGDPKQYVDKVLKADEHDGRYEIAFIVTPQGGGSPAGMHTHSSDQHFLILDGVMNLEIDGKPYKAERGTFITFPAGVPHKNWNEGSEATVHLSILKRAPGEGAATQAKR